MYDSLSFNRNYLAGVTRVLLRMLCAPHCKNSESFPHLLDLTYCYDLFTLSVTQVKENHEHNIKSLLNVVLGIFQQEITEIGCLWVGLIVDAVTRLSREQLQHPCLCLCTLRLLRSDNPFLGVSSHATVSQHIELLWHPKDDQGQWRLH